MFSQRPASSLSYSRLEVKVNADQIKPAVTLKLQYMGIGHLLNSFSKLIGAAWHHSS